MPSARKAQQDGSARLRLALPKGRLAKDLEPLLERVGLTPEAAFDDERERRLIYRTAQDGVEVLQAKPFDVATLVAVGGAQLGICGADVLYEFDYSEVYAPVDLRSGVCRLSLAGLPQQLATPLDSYPRPLRIATKYPGCTRRYCAARGIEVEIIPLNGSIELAPHLDVADRIVDLVSTGETLRANQLEEEAVLFHSSARLLVNRTASKLMPQRLKSLVEAFEAASAALYPLPEPD